MGVSRGGAAKGVAGGSDHGGGGQSAGGYFAADSRIGENSAQFLRGKVRFSGEPGERILFREFGLSFSRGGARFRAVVIGDWCIFASYEKGKKSQKVEVSGPKVAKSRGKVRESRGKVGGSRGLVAAHGAGEASAFSYEIDKEPGRAARGERGSREWPIHRGAHLRFCAHRAGIFGIQVQH